MSLQSLVQEVQVAAEEVTSGKKESHGQLLRAIHNLNLAVETPAETLGRILYQVSCASTAAASGLEKLYSANPISHTVGAKCYTSTGGRNGTSCRCCVKGRKVNYCS